MQLAIYRYSKSDAFFKNYENSWILKNSQEFSELEVEEFSEFFEIENSSAFFKNPTLKILDETQEFWIFENTRNSWPHNFEKPLKFLDFREHQKFLVVKF